MSDERRSPDPAGLACPLPLADYPTVQMAHGGGGRLSQKLIDGLFVAAFDNPVLRTLHDGALLELGGARLAFSTDSFVIRPLFFPGGDIGSLAVHGTVNDVAMCGARPLVISAAFILEEGFPMEDLWRITRSMQTAAAEAGVTVVTGDTKVVDRGKGDGVYVNTTGLGLLVDGVDVSPRRARPGDAVLISGAIAVHGIAIMSVREGLEFETELRSDSAALNSLVASLLERAGEELHVLRDPTRGGVASALNEIAGQAGVGIRLDEARIPIWDAVRGGCEILGLDPLYVANEGKCLAIVEGDSAEAVLAAMREHPLGSEAAIIGEVVAEHPGKVVLRSRIGGERIVDMLCGEQLPRICCGRALVLALRLARPDQGHRGGRREGLEVAQSRNFPARDDDEDGLRNGLQTGRRYGDLVRHVFLAGKRIRACVRHVFQAGKRVSDCLRRVREPGNRPIGAETRFS